MKAFTLLSLMALATKLVTGCSPEASKEPGLPCDNAIQCREGYTCLASKNGVSGQCIEPVCSRACKVDGDCKGIRVDAAGGECFVCRDVSGCKSGGPGYSAEAGAGSFACVDRCVAQ
ncbi:MAG: hypothetical protein IPG50_23840 [Myxococcales bacterium]|nr:hypothetical protein [Myxococcales bacterium]